jgi:hypothetical protein
MVAVDWVGVAGAINLTVDDIRIILEIFLRGVRLAVESSHIHVVLTVAFLVAGARTGMHNASVPRHFSPCLGNPASVASVPGECLANRISL